MPQLGVERSLSRNGIWYILAKKNLTSDRNNFNVKTVPPKARKKKKEITVHTHALPRSTSKNVLADAYMATMQPILETHMCPSIYHVDVTCYAGKLYST